MVLKTRLTIAEKPAAADGVMEVRQQAVWTDHDVANIKYYAVKLFMH
jgi:hypothetical protein